MTRDQAEHLATTLLTTGCITAYDIRPAYGQGRTKKTAVTDWDLAVQDPGLGWITVQLTGDSDLGWTMVIPEVAT